MKNQQSINLIEKQIKEVKGRIAPVVLAILGVIGLLFFIIPGIILFIIAAVISSSNRNKINELELELTKLRGGS